MVAGVAAAVVALPSTAWASFTSVGRAAATVSSATLAAPTSVATTKKCSFLGIFGDTLTVSWTASSTTMATGYTLDLNAGSGSDITRTISGRSTTSVNVSVAPGTTYTITVSSVLKNWTAASTAVRAGCSITGL